MARKYEKKDLTEAVKNSICWSDVCRALNITVCTFNFNNARKQCNDYNISFDHFNLKAAYRKNKKHWAQEQIYTANSLFPRAQLRKKVLTDGWLNYRCRDCGNEGLWNKKSIVLEIEHINGINDDHRKENLTWLCPNCHSQTESYRNNKNRRADSLEVKSGVLITPGS